MVSRNWVLSGLGLTVSALLAVASVGVANAEDGTVEEWPEASLGNDFELPDPAAVPEGLQGALDTFIRPLAEATGQTVEETLLQQTGAIQLSAVMTEVDFRFPGLSLYAEWRTDAVPGALVVFPGDAPEAAIEIIHSAPIEIELQFSNGPTVEESNATISRIFERISTTQSLPSGSASFDVQEQSYSVTYQGPALSDEVVGELRGLTNGLPLELEAVEGEAASFEYRGGGHLTHDWCTAGFVIRNGSTYGITTARHCDTPGNFAYDGGYFWNGAGSLPWTQGDIRWAWSVSGTPANTFQRTPGSYGTVHSVHTPVVGSGYCQYGRTTGSTCGTIGSINQTIYLDSIDVMKLTCATSHQTSDGDSGGPIYLPMYYGDVAMGIHSGRKWTGSKYVSCFTPISALGIPVYTS